MKGTRIRACVGRRLGASTMAALMLMVMPAVAHASGTTYAYPGASPCDTTLQECIDFADPGDTIEIATDTRIDEDLTIRKSLTLRAWASAHPRIGSGDPTTPRTVSVSDSAGEAVQVTFAHLRFDAARVSVRLWEHAGDRFTLTDSAITHRADSNNDRGVDVDARVDGAVVTIARNTIETTGAPVSVLTLLPGTDQTAAVTILGNRLVAAKRVDAYHGLTIDLRGSGRVRVDAQSNVIRHAMGCNCGGSGSLYLAASDAVVATVAIVGNTIDHAQGSFAGVGIDLDTRGLSGQLSVSIFDNVVSYGTGAAIVLPDATPSVRVAMGSNDFFGNGQPDEYGGYPPTIPMLSVPPGYVDASAGDYHLRASSKLRDRGDACAGGGLPRTDAANRFRVAGPTVDIGAYEFAAGRAAKGVNRLGSDGPDVLTGTAGDDVLCGLGGADTLTGGPGRDHLFGGGGSDALDARDGSAGDWLDGGPGRDTCRSDPGDIDVGCP